MLQITPQMKILVAIEPADFRKGIDGLAQLCREALREDPFTSLSAVRKNVLPELKIRAGFFNLGELRDRVNTQ